MILVLVLQGIQANFDKNKEVFLENFGSGEHTIAYPPIIVKVQSISVIGATTTIQPQLDPVVLGSIENVYLQEGGTGYGSTNIVDFHRRPNVEHFYSNIQGIIKTNYY